MVTGRGLNQGPLPAPADLQRGPGMTSWAYREEEGGSLDPREGKATHVSTLSKDGPLPRWAPLATTHHTAPGHPD
jgi:hypothetical protein